VVGKQAVGGDGAGATRPSSKLPQLWHSSAEQVKIEKRNLLVRRPLELAECLETEGDGQWMDIGT